MFARTRSEAVVAAMTIHEDAVIARRCEVVVNARKTCVTTVITKHDVKLLIGRARCEAALIDGRFETAATASRFGWIKFGECEKIFYLLLERTVYKSYVRLCVLYGNEVWRLRENHMTILGKMRAMCGVQLNFRKKL